MLDEEKIIVSRAALETAIADIHSLIEGTVAAFKTAKGNNGIASIDNRIEAMLEILFNKAIDKKVRSSEF